MSITNKLNQIKNAIYGKEVRGAIHDAIKECYVDASVNHDNANMEVKMARGPHNTLNDRLDNVEAQTNAQLSQKADKDDLLTNKIFKGADTTENILKNQGVQGEYYYSTDEYVYYLRSDKSWVNVGYGDNKINELVKYANLEYTFNKYLSSVGTFIATPNNNFRVSNLEVKPLERYEITGRCTGNQRLVAIFDKNNKPIDIFPRTEEGVLLDDKLYNTTIEIPLNGTKISVCSFIDLPTVCQLPTLSYNKFYFECEINNQMSVSEINYLLNSGYGRYIFKSGIYNLTADESIVVRSNTTISFENGAVLKQTTLDATHYNLIYVKDCENVVIESPQIQGERGQHIGTTGEWGHGISIYSSKNITINNANIYGTWGDGIYIGLEYWEDYKFKNEKIVINNPYIDYCSRNGISICTSLDVTVINPIIKNVNRTAPRAAIDIEPEWSSDEGIFLGRVYVNKLYSYNCHQHLCYYNDITSNGANTVIVDEIITDGGHTGIYLGCKREGAKGTLRIGRIVSNYLAYYVLFCRNKPKNWNVTINDIVCHKLPQGTSEKSSFIVIETYDETRVCGNLYINNIFLDDTYDKYEFLLACSGGMNFDDLYLGKVSFVPTKSQRSILNLQNTTNVNLMDVDYIKILDDDTVISNDDLARNFFIDNLEKNIKITFNNDIPDGIYSIQTSLLNGNSCTVELNNGENQLKKMLSATDDGAFLSIFKINSSFFIRENNSWS